MAAAGGRGASPLQGFAFARVATPGESVVDTYPAFWAGALKAQSRGRPCLLACKEPEAGSGLARLSACYQAQVIAQPGGVKSRFY